VSTPEGVRAAAAYVADIVHPLLRPYGWRQKMTIFTRDLGRMVFLRSTADKPECISSSARAANVHHTGIRFGRDGVYDERDPRVQMKSRVKSAACLGRSGDAIILAS
jgi:hypothetical protein